VLVVVRGKMGPMLIGGSVMSNAPFTTDESRRTAQRAKSFFESSFFQVRAKYKKKEAFAAARLDVGPYFF